MNEPTEERIDRWKDLAEENTEKWGIQPPAHVLLAIMEELAEISEDFLINVENTSSRRSPEEREMVFLLTEIISLGDYVQTRLDNLLEDGDGNPLPPERRPDVAGDITDKDPINEEIDDIAPLIIQLARSVDEYSRW